MKAETVRERMNGDYEKAVQVFALVSTVYRPVSTAPKRAWERAINLINKKEKEVENENISDRKQNQWS